MLGLRDPVYCIAATDDLLAVMLPDAAGGHHSRSPQPGVEVARGSAVSLQLQGMSVPEQKPSAGGGCVVADRTSQRQQSGDVFRMAVKPSQSPGGLHYADEVRALVACVRFTGPGRNYIAPNAPARRCSCACRPIDAVQVLKVIDHTAWSWNVCCVAVR